MRSIGGRECKTAGRFALGRTDTVGRFMSKVVKLDYRALKDKSFGES